MALGFFLETGKLTSLLSSETLRIATKSKLDLPRYYSKKEFHESVKGILAKRFESGHDIDAKNILSALKGFLDPSYFEDSNKKTAFNTLETKIEQTTKGMDKSTKSNFCQNCQAVVDWWKTIVPEKDLRQITFTDKSKVDQLVRLVGGTAAVIALIYTFLHLMFDYVAPDSALVNATYENAAHNQSDGSVPQLTLFNAATQFGGSVINAVANLLPGDANQSTSAINSTFSNFTNQTNLTAPFSNSSSNLP